MDWSHRQKCVFRSLTVLTSNSSYFWSEECSRSAVSQNMAIYCCAVKLREPQCQESALFQGCFISLPRPPSFFLSGEMVGGCWSLINSPDLIFCGPQRSAMVACCENRLDVSRQNSHAPRSCLRTFRIRLMLVSQDWKPPFHVITGKRCNLNSYSPHTNKSLTAAGLWTKADWQETSLCL